MSLADQKAVRVSTCESERELIARALRSNSGDKVHAAEQLKISRKKLTRRSRLQPVRSVNGADNRMAMSMAIEIAPEDLYESVVPSQYNDLIRHRSPAAEGEYRLLWAVLEDAIRTYLANRPCSNPIQQERFEHVRRWFEAAQESGGGLFGFQTICDLLEIDSGRLLARLKSVGPHAFPVRRHRLVRTVGIRNLAA